MNNTQQILEDMRKLTMLNGEISSIHELNLKKWPFVAFEGVESSEVDYDLTKDTIVAKGEGFVEFKLAIEPMAENSLMKQRCETITAWVRDMFWPEIRVSVFFNGIEQYSDSTMTEENILKESKELFDKIEANEKEIKNSLAKGIGAAKDGPNQD